MCLKGYDDPSFTRENLGCQSFTSQPRFYSLSRNYLCFIANPLHKLLSHLTSHHTSRRISNQCRARAAVIWRFPWIITSRFGGGFPPGRILRGPVALSILQGPTKNTRPRKYSRPSLDSHAHPIDLVSSLFGNLHVQWTQVPWNVGGSP